MANARRHRPTALEDRGNRARVGGKSRWLRRRSHAVRYNLARRNDPQLEGRDTSARLHFVLPLRLLAGGEHRPRRELGAISHAGTTLRLREKRNTLASRFVQT